MRQRIGTALMGLGIVALLLIGALGTWQSPTPAWAQNTQCSTRAPGDNTNACASTAFVQAATALLPTVPWTVPQGGTGQSSFTANLPLIGNGTSAIAQGTRSGNTTAFVTLTGSATSGRCAQFDANGNVAAAASACAAGTGDVVGPGSATDNAVARFDTTTGKLIQNSAVTIADTTGAMAGVGSIAMPGSSSGTVTISPQATAGTPTLTLPNASGTIAVSGTAPIAVSATTGAISTSIATQADMEAASSLVTVVTPGRVVSAPGVAKVWANFNGTNSNPITPLAQYGVSGTITKNGTGDYTVTFATACSSANYAWVAFAGNPSTSLGFTLNISGAKLAGSFRFGTYSSGVALTDYPEVTLAVFCDQ